MHCAGIWKYLFVAALRASAVGCGKAWKWQGLGHRHGPAKVTLGEGVNLNWAKNSGKLAKKVDNAKKAKKEQDESKRVKMQNGKTRKIKEMKNVRSGVC